MVAVAVAIPVVVGSCCWSYGSCSFACIVAVAAAVDVVVAATAIMRARGLVVARAISAEAVALVVILINSQQPLNQTSCWSSSIPVTGACFTVCMIRTPRTIVDGFMHCTPIHPLRQVSELIPWTWQASVSGEHLDGSFCTCLAGAGSTHTHTDSYKKSKRRSFEGSLCSAAKRHWEEPEATRCLPKHQWKPKRGEVACRDGASGSTLAECRNLISPNSSLAFALSPLPSRKL